MALVLLMYCTLGLVNGLLVEIAQIDSFIVTLGTGTVIYAIALWYTEGRQVIGVLPDGFLALYIYRLFGIPIAALYVRPTTSPRVAISGRTTSMRTGRAASSAPS